MRSAPATGSALRTMTSAHLTLRIAATALALLSVLPALRLRSKWAAIVGWIPKQLAATLSPWLAGAGLLGAAAGVDLNDPGVVTLCVAALAMAVRHMLRVTRSHDGFREAFGPDWEDRISGPLDARMLASRRLPILPPAEPVQWQRDVSFGRNPDTGESLLADLWQPPPGVTPTGLALVYLHGGGWHFADKDQGTRRVFRHLAAQGHAVMDVAYTLAPHTPLEGMVGDVKRAVAWLKTQAQSLGISPERIVLSGGSAGGHLALLAAYAPHLPELTPPDLPADPSVRAVVSLYGPPDLLAVQRLAEAMFPPAATGPKPGRRPGPAEWLPNLLGGSPDERPERYHLASPLEHVGPHCPPTLLLQGAHDVTRIAPDVRRLGRTLSAAGVPVVHVEVPEADHGFDLILPRWSPAYRASTYDLERFLALML